MNDFFKALKLVFSNRTYFIMALLTGIVYASIYVFLVGIVVIAGEKSQPYLAFDFDPFLILATIVISFLVSLTIPLSIFTIKRVPRGCKSGCSTGAGGFFVSMIGCCAGITTLILALGGMSIALFINQYFYVFVISTIILLVTSIILLLSRIGEDYDALKKEVKK